MSRHQSSPLVSEVCFSRCLFPVFGTRDPFLTWVHAPYPAKKGPAQLSFLQISEAVMEYWYLIVTYLVYLRWMSSRTCAGQDWYKRISCSVHRALYSTHYTFRTGADRNLHFLFASFCRVSSQNGVRAMFDLFSKYKWRHLI